jgi:hypothetical protein
VQADANLAGAQSFLQVEAADLVLDIFSGPAASQTDLRDDLV